MNGTDELATFLLARIAEDEAVARETLAGSDPLDWSEPSDPAVGLAGPVDGPSGYESIVIDPARVLGECEAKRSLIEWAQGLEYLREVGDPKAPERPVGNEVLQIMAQPYADHPDYPHDVAWTS